MRDYFSIYIFLTISVFCLLNTAIVWRDLRLHHYRKQNHYSYVKSLRVLNTGSEKIGATKIIHSCKKTLVRHCFNSV